jgi:hypothetical protein
MWDMNTTRILQNLIIYGFQGVCSIMIIIEWHLKMVIYDIIINPNSPNEQVLDMKLEIIRRNRLW